MTSDGYWSSSRKVICILVSATMHEQTCCIIQLKITVLFYVDYVTGKDILVKR